MDPITIPAGTRLKVTYSIHKASNPKSELVIVLHHGICHTRDQFEQLIRQLNALGIHAAMIDQQSENAGFFRNAIGVNSYREGMACAVRKIEKELPIGSYVFHSMGALIGEEMQQAYPELRRPTVLMAPIPVNGALPITLRMARRHPLNYLKAVLTLDIHSLVKTPQQVRELFFDANTPESIIQKTTPQLKHAPFWIYCQLVLRPLVRKRIRNDGQPKLLFFSETDEVFHPREFEKTRRQYPQMNDARFDSGGHDFFIEYAAAAAEQIAEFHTRHTKPPPPPAPHFAHKPDAAKRTKNEGLLEVEEE